MSWKHSDGSLRTNNYIVPHANQCKSCHVATEKTFLPLGPKARNLNKEFAYHGGKENQLAHWTHIGALDGCARAGQAPRAARFDDPTTGSVEQRARVWLDVNCAHCHNPHGPARTTGLDLQLSQDEPRENRRLQIAGGRRPRLGRKQVRHRPRQAGRIDRASTGSNRPNRA